MPEELCEFCGKPVSPSALDTYKRIHGWVRNRKQGGTNSVTLPSDTMGFAHGYCIDQQKRDGSVSWHQRNLFD